MKATYNITDDRLKVWFDDRLPEEEYKQIRSLGMSWFPGQKCFSGVWSPGREDFILAYCQIDDDETLDDLTARVERFQKYAANNERDAIHAQERATNANTARQLRQAESTAEYKIDAAAHWQNRIAGAISNAEYKDRPDVIARRIKKLQAAQRKHQKNRDNSQAWLNRWENGKMINKETKEEATPRQRALYFANYDQGISGTWRRLTQNEITPEETQEIAISHHTRKIEYTDRWLEHLAKRLEYETSYLVAVGGSEKMLEPKARRKSTAPDDGLKKGDTVNFNYGVNQYTGTILTLSALTARLDVTNCQSLKERNPKGYKHPRRFLKKVAV